MLCVAGNLFCLTFRLPYDLLQALFSRPKRK